MKFKTVWSLVRVTVEEWLDDNSQRLAASLSYYTIFSIAPILLIVIAITGFVLGNDFAQEKILAQIKSLIGETGGRAIVGMLQNSNKPAQGIFSAITGIFLLLVGATGVVGELKAALNTIWEVERQPSGGVMGLIRDRILSLAMILGIGFLLLVSLVISAMLSALTEFWGSSPAFGIQALNEIISIGVITLLFAMMFKFLPDLKLRWRDVWVGALVTAMLFTIGKTLTGIYLAHSSVASAFGAAGSLVIVLVWVYYSACILFLGAEFTHVYSSFRSEKAERQGDFQDMSIARQKEKKKKPLIRDPNVPASAEGKDRKNDSTLLSVARHSGYQAARIQHSIEPVKKNVEKKLKILSWTSKIIDFLGFKRSAILAWKGYKVKNKLDHLKANDSKNEDLDEPFPEVERS